jgi:hypothetical protein
MPLVEHRWVLGCDPGWNGYICCYQPSTKSFHLHEVEESRIVEGIDWAREFAEQNEIAFCVLEEVGVMPWDSKQNCYTFGRAVEHMRTLTQVMGAGKEFGLLTPKPTTWQKAMNCVLSDVHKGKTKPERRTLLKQLQAERVKNMFGNVLPFKVTQTNASAILLAEYARRLYSRMA